MKLSFNTVSLTAAAPRARLVILHGFLGSARNWKSLQNALASRLPNHAVTALDLRNHGATLPHVPTMGYADMAKDVAHFLKTSSGSGAPTTLLGHSMGGKVAMTLALTQPQLLERLVVVDIAPADYGESTGDHHHMIDAMMRVPLPATLRDATASLERDGVASRAVRDFLLTNLSFGEGGVAREWRVPLATFRASLAELRSFPRFPDSVAFTKPALFIGGADAAYLTAAHEPEVVRLFPHSVTRHIAGAGHWVHADKPHEFVAAVTAFMDAAAHQ